VGPPSYYTVQRVYRRFLIETMNTALLRFLGRLEEIEDQDPACTSPVGYQPYRQF
jgi:hypothetical protein